MGITPVAFAGLKVSPIQLYISDQKNQRSTTLNFDYSGSKEAKIFEAVAMKWTQNAQGEEVLEPDTTLLINPKNFVVQPNSKQIIRIGFAHPVSSMGLKEEGTWRVIFNEVAPIVEQNAMSFLFNISLPVFVGKQTKADLSFQPHYVGNHLYIRTQNNALSHIQIKELTLLNAQGRQLSKSQDMKYLLAKQSYAFDFGVVVLDPKQKYQLKVLTDKSDLTLDYGL